jgi:hypothetical protein
MYSWHTIRLMVLLIAEGVAIVRSDSGYAEPILRAFAGNAEYCLISGSRSSGQREGIGLALATSVIQSVARSSASALGKYLNEAAQSTSSPLLIAVTDVDLFRIVKRAQDNQPHIESNLECLVIVNGEFGVLPRDNLPPAFSARAAALDPDQLFVKRTGEQPDPSILIKLGLLDLPKSYLEFVVQRHRSSSAVRLSPSFVYFRESSAIMNPQNAKNVEVVATFVLPSATGSLDVGGVANSESTVMQLPVVINRLTPGLIRRVAVPASNVDNVWVREPGQPDESQMQGAKRESASIGGITTFWPNNVFVTYREADKPSLILHMLSTFLVNTSDKN